jgi:hypothetical protein
MVTLGQSKTSSNQRGNESIQKLITVDEYLTDQEIMEFQQLALQVYGKTLSFEEAREQSTKLAMAFDLMLDNLDAIDNDKN